MSELKPHELHVSVRMRCPHCIAGIPRIPELQTPRYWAHYYPDKPGSISYGKRCTDFDDECRHISQPFGFHLFAWLPRRCRNGKLRWLTWLEHHVDGTFTLGNRAH